MKITERMLKNWIVIPKDIKEITNQKIVEVEDKSPLCQANNLVVGHVLTCDKHPDSDHLSLTTVDIGIKVEQIVCGAANIAKGQYVIVATIGTVLPGNFKIKPVKIRGVESNGMICSLQELGLDEKYIPQQFLKGIFNFDYVVKTGTSAIEALALDGWVMELGLTPNRSDLLSVLGFAYDFAAMSNQTITIPKYKIKETKNKNPLKITIETKGCARYYGAYIEEVSIKESPWWLKSALIAALIAPVNNVVDISNYVLLEYGTPLHMFDAIKVGTNLITIKQAQDGQTVVTLDDKTRVLSNDDIVITNGEKVIAIGGVMGLKNTMVDNETNKIILEAAYFDPMQTRSTSKRLNLKSEASLRFERGIDDKRVILGLNRALELLIQLADAKVSSGISSSLSYEIENPEIEIEKSYFNKTLGVQISEAELINYFKAYNYTYSITKQHYVVKAPSYRNDLKIKADILEEISRIYGLDKIPTKPVSSQTIGRLSFKQKRIRALRNQLADFGLNEIISYTLIKEKEVYQYNNIGDFISILMPLSNDKKTLRQSLVHGLLDTIKYNQSRQQQNIAIFEIGNCFAKDIEDLHLGISLSGLLNDSQWKKQELSTDFFVLKGILDKVFNAMGIYFDYVSLDNHKAYHPYRQANIIYQDEILGQIAEIHPLEAKKLNISATVVLDINLASLLKKNRDLMYTEISKYPNVSRDIAVIVDEKITAEELVSTIKQTIKHKLVNVQVFDVYKGDNIESDKKSIALSLTFNNKEETLKSEEIDQLINKIIKKLNYKYQAVIRN